MDHKSNKTETDFVQYAEFDKHNSVTYFRDENSGLEGYIAIHRKNVGVPSFGATRFWSYSTRECALKDALRLSRMMSYKAALAGLPCGGAKAVIMKPNNLENKNQILKAYADRLNELNGEFITGTDVGLCQADIEFAKEFTTKLVGFNNNATEATAAGLVSGIKVTLEHLTGSDDIQGKSFAIQGLGKVGEELLSLIYNDASIIYVSEINDSIVEQIIEKYPKVKVVPTSDIHTQQVDVFAPCALSHSLNKDTVKELQCKIVAGAANNQLEDMEVGDEIYQRGILYAPDYVVNAGGLIAVFDEYENGEVNKNIIPEQVDLIGKRLKDILVESDKLKKPTHRIANTHAEVMFNKYE